jgi:hypothetical protein
VTRHAGHAAWFSGEPVILSGERLEGCQNLAHARRVAQVPVTAVACDCLPRALGNHFAILQEQFLFDNSSILSGQRFPSYHRAPRVLHVVLLAPQHGVKLQVLTDSSSLFRSQAMQPPSSGAWAAPEGRDWRGHKMEETMRLLTIAELMRRSKIELCNLAARISRELPGFPEGSPERANAVKNLANIRLILVRRDFSP